MKPSYVNDVLPSNLKVFWEAYVKPSGLIYSDWEKLPEEAREPMLHIVRDLRDVFEVQRKEWCIPVLSVPWVNALMVYGPAGFKSALGLAHEVKGYCEYSRKMLNEKANCLEVHAYLMGLIQDPEFYSRALLESFVLYELDIPLQEFYSTEFVERNVAEKRSKTSEGEPGVYRDACIERFEEFERIDRVESIREIPQEHWILYRYVVARQLKKACKAVNINPRELIEALGKLVIREVRGGEIVDMATVGRRAIVATVKALRLVAEGIELSEAVKQAVKSTSGYVGKAYECFRILYGGDFAHEYTEGFSDAELLVFNNPDKAFSHFCSEVYSTIKANLAARLLYVHPFNRIFTEPLIVVSEDKDIYVRLRIPKDLKKYLARSPSLVAALVNAKMMLLKLWEEASMTSLYKVDLNHAEKIQVKDVEIETPKILLNIRRAEALRGLAEDPAFIMEAENLQKHLIKAAGELRILK
ncbi:MAG: hypothetical protein QXO76_01800 [Thermoproteota archaeon]